MENLLLKIYPSEITSFLSNNSFLFRGSGDVRLVSPCYATEFLLENFQDFLFNPTKWKHCNFWIDLSNSSTDKSFLNSEDAFDYRFNLSVKNCFKFDIILLQMKIFRAFVNSADTTPQGDKNGAAMILFHGEHFKESSSKWVR